MKKMLEQAGSLIFRMRWKAHNHENTDEVADKKTYGFKSARVPKPLEPLKAFEEDLYNMVCSIEMKHHHDPFQQQLSKDVREIRSSKEVYVPADKTNNYYRMSGDKYRQLLTDNVTREYQHSSNEAKTHHRR